MPIAKLSEWLFPGDGDGSSAPAQVSKEVGAAGLLVAAAHRDGHYSDVESDLAAAAMMKLFMLTNPDAKALVRDAEKELFEGRRSFMTFAVAAKKLDREDQETLIRHLWRLVETDGETLSENLLVSSVRDVFGMSREEAALLKGSNA